MTAARRRLSGVEAVAMFRGFEGGAGQREGVRWLWRRRKAVRRVGGWDQYSWSARVVDSSMPQREAWWVSASAVAAAVGELGGGVRVCSGAATSKDGEVG